MEQYDSEIAYTVERDSDSINIPGDYYDEILEFASNLHRQMSTDKGALVPDGHGLIGLGYVESFETILRTQEANILLSGYRLKDYYGYHFARYSMFYKIPLPEFFPEYRKLGRNEQTGQFEFDAKFKKCVSVTKLSKPAPAHNRIVEKPAFIEAQNDSQALEIRAICRWMNKQREAKNRGIEFALSVEDFKELLKTSHCHYTGIPLICYDEAAETPPDDQLTIDRIDNEKGYEKGNVVACSYIANSIKSDGDIGSIQDRLSRIQEEIHKTEHNINLLTEKLENLKQQESVLLTVVEKLCETEEPEEVADNTKELSKELNKDRDTVAETTEDAFADIMRKQNVTPINR